MADPMISVVIPAFNAERYLGEAVQSVLNQSRPADEIIIVDDGSSDGTADVARSFGSAVQLIEQANRGVSSARNRGVDASTRELIAFLDADDTWVPGKLEIQAAVLSDRPELDAVFGMAQVRVEAVAAEGVAQAWQQLPQVMPGMLAGAMLIRRTSFERVRFDDAFTGAEFVEWILRARQQGLQMTMPEEVVFVRRVHDANYGLRGGDTQRNLYFSIIRSALAQRRAAQDLAAG